MSSILTPQLSKLTKATVVYRGVAGGVLPPSLQKPNELNLRGGAEAGFMSTTEGEGEGEGEC